MKKWRPLFSSLLPSDPKPRNPQTPFRPRLIFANTIPRPPFHYNTATNRTPSIQIHPRPKPNTFHPSKPHHRIFAQNRSKCYRCGGGGHLARVCRYPIRCYHCGVLGHKRFKCPSSGKVKTMPTLSREKGNGRDNDSWLLQSAQTMDPVRSMDSMLLDPDVIAYSYRGRADLPLRPFSSSTPNNEELIEASNPDLGATAVGLNTDGLALGCEDRAVGFKQSGKGAVGIDLRIRSEARFAVRFSAPVTCLKLHRIRSEARFAKTSILFDKLGLEALLHRLDVAKHVVHPSGKLNSNSTSCLNLSEITIIDKLRSPSSEKCSRDMQADITFFIKPFKFFLYCFLAAFRHCSSLVPPVESWRSQLYSSHLNFNFSSPDSAAVNICIFGRENVFSSKSSEVKNKRKLVFTDTVRRSPRFLASR